jgi:selenocysteine lyase/cysteine desulfurase
MSFWRPLHKLIVFFDPYTQAHGLRISPHFYNTDEELERFFTALSGKI